MDCFFFFFKQKTAYEMRIGDWSSDVCSSDLFHPFLDDKGVRIVGVEAAGHGIASGQLAPSLTGGRPGVLHGNRPYLLQNDDGQITDAHSIQGGLAYPGLGPEHSWLHDHGRVRTSVVVGKLGDVAVSTGGT